MREVNKLLGGTQEEGGKGSEGGAIGGNETSILNHSLLKVDRRYVTIHWCAGDRHIPIPDS